MQEHANKNVQVKQVMQTTTEQLQEVQQTNVQLQVIFFMLTRI